MRSDTNHRPLSLLAELVSAFIATPTTWIAVLGVVAVYMAIARLDEMDNHHDEFAQADSLRIEQARRIAGVARQRAAQALCSSSNGPNVLAVWTDSSTVECLSNHGRRVNRFSMEASNVR